MATLLHALKFPSCVMLALRAANPVGHDVTAYHDVSGCDVPSRQVPTVIDAVGDYDQRHDQSEYVVSE